MINSSSLTGGTTKDLIDITKILHFVQNDKKQILINFIIATHSACDGSNKVRKLNAIEIKFGGFAALNPPYDLINFPNQYLKYPL